MKPLHQETLRVAFVLTIALAARLAFVVWWQRTHLANEEQFEFPDSPSYWELGQHMARGEPYQFGSVDRSMFRAPGYPLLLAAMFRVVGLDAKPVAARVMGAVIGALTVGCVYWLARILFSAEVAIVAAAIVAVLPETVATSVFPLSDGPFCLWMMLELVFVGYAWGSSSQATRPTRAGEATSFKTGWGFAMSAGVMGGVATLTRPSWLLFTPALVAVWWIGSRFEMRRLLLGGAMLVGLVIVMLPWWVRNYRLIGRFVPTTLQVGESLYDGLNPEANGSSDMRFVPRIREHLRASDTVRVPAASERPFEYRLDRFMWNESIQWAAAHPGRVVELAGTKFLRLWNVWPNEPSFRGGWARLAICLTYTPVLLLSIAGAWMIRRRAVELMLLAAPAVYLTAMHMVFIGSLRYRQPAMLTLAILTAVAVCELAGRSTTQSSATAAMLN